MDPYAQGLAHLKTLAEEHSESGALNEATTRFRMIDALLTNCLAWPSAEVNCERYHSQEYTDYELGGRGVEAILEAKKEGLYFEVPAGVAGRRIVEIPTLLTNVNARAAIEQVAGYCQTRGVPVGIVSNGHQLIAFYASRQDGPPLEGQALLFSSLTEMVEDFEGLWNTLSREGLAARNLQRLLLGMSGAMSPPGKLSDRIPSYPGFRSRTSLETDLRILGGAFLQDIESEDSVSEEFLRDCYCNSGALSQYSFVSREILKNRYKALKSEGLDIVAVKDRRGLNPRVSADLVASALTRRPLILLGDVGVGKTMFLKHLLKIEAADVLASSQVFYINFGVEPAIETNLEEHVYRRISAQLIENYDVDPTESTLVRAIYNKELNRLAKTVLGELRETDPAAYRREEIAELSALTAQRATHLRRLFEHQRGTKGTQSVVVLDNIDQRDPTFQDRVFVIAQSLAETWPTTVFVSLRPSTFHESKSKGALAAYQLRVFTVSPTRVDDVVGKRLEYAATQVQRQVEAGAFPQHLSIGGKDLLAYLEVLRGAFAGDDRLNELLDNLSGGNLRVALTFLSNFVGSGYVSTERILQTASEGRLYSIPMHEFLRAMIFAEYDYFDPKFSEICNIFDLSTNDPREHFLMALILGYIQREGESASADHWVELQDIYTFGQGLLFSVEQVSSQVYRALDKRLIDAKPGSGRAGPFRITSVGSYMYRKMPEHFSYLDAMIVDTPICDIDTARVIQDERSILDRLTRGRAFVSYLDECWANAKLEAQSYFSWPPLSQLAVEEIERATDKASRAAERRRR